MILRNTGEKKRNKNGSDTSTNNWRNIVFGYNINSSKKQFGFYLRGIKELEIKFLM